MTLTSQNLGHSLRSTLVHILDPFPTPSRLPHLRSSPPTSSFRSILLLAPSYLILLLPFHYYTDPLFKTRSSLTSTIQSTSRPVDVQYKIYRRLSDCRPTPDRARTSHIARCLPPSRPFRNHHNSIALHRFTPSDCLPVYNTIRCFALVAVVNFSLSEKEPGLEASHTHRAQVVILGLCLFTRHTRCCLRHYTITHIARELWYWPAPRDTLTAPSVWQVAQQAANHV